MFICIKERTASLRSRSCSSRGLEVHLVHLGDVDKALKVF